jgi:hypothetical protein
MAILNGCEIFRDYLIMGHPPILTVLFNAARASSLKDFLLFEITVCPNHR